MRKLGSLDPIVYFVNRDGRAVIPPVSTMPTPKGWERKEADSLAEVDRLQKRLERQERDECEQMAQHDWQIWEKRRQEIRDRLVTRMISAATGEYEKEFIKAYLKLSDERKRELYQKRFMLDVAYFHAREFDHKHAKHDELEL